MRYLSPQFKKLQAEWYKKLEETGFKDIEQNSEDDKGNPFLKQFEKSRLLYSRTNGRSAEEWWEEKRVQQTYYNKAGQFLHSYRFDSLKDETIWKLHSEGNSYREIRKQTGVYVQYIGTLIKRLAKIMKERKDDSE